MFSIRRSIHHHVPNIHNTSGFNREAHTSIYAILLPAERAETKISQRIIFAISSSREWFNVSCLWSLIFPMLYFLLQFRFIDDIFYFSSCRAPDLTSQLLELLNEFVYQLVCSGQLMMAKLLRNKILEKVRSRHIFHDSSGKNGYFDPKSQHCLRKID